MYIYEILRPIGGFFILWNKMGCQNIINKTSIKRQRTQYIFTTSPKEEKAMWGIN